MAHAVPTRGTSTGARTGGTGTGRDPGRDASGRRTPDVFGARTHLLAKWAMPLAIGLVYGYWAASVRRHGGPVTGWNLLFGFMTVLAFALLWYVVRAVADRLPREGHAVLWGAFAGSALGFLYSGSGVAMFTCVLVSLLLAAAVTAGLYYLFATRQDAEDARAARHRTLTRTT
ncbi:hypothetical protein [Streptomyces rubrogriseus]|uniref:Uncharacterized protein n=1 Tax=Streptomyces rubrogriseus TaxID=194673 RepID=A0A6G3TMV9_9ACTN|nr:hypothetical protein [Streptomyces rubrogriseus]NEC37638.1 hypothetical protein [Streptomyces rubrogriseus]